MTQPLISLQEVSFGYHAEGEPILQRFSMEMPESTITVILGPNGVGKTTLLHLLLGWLQPQKGRILLDGRPMQEYSRQERGRSIGLTPQGEHIPFDYSVLEYILLGRTPYLKPLETPDADDISIAEAALDQVGLYRWRHRSVTTLSSGERQLVLLARALTQQPRLLLLDEPMAHLDLGNKFRLLNLIRKLHGQGISILFTGHDPDVAAGIATQVLLLQSGNRYRIGPPESILTGEILTEVYGLPIKVLLVEGKPVVLWNRSPLEE